MVPATQMGERSKREKKDRGGASGTAPDIFVALLWYQGVDSKSSGRMSVADQLISRVC